LQALEARAELLVLDEPAAGLDREARGELARLLQDAAEGGAAFAEPAPQRDVAATAAGGPGAALRARLGACLVAGAALVLVDLVFPVAAGAFDRSVAPADLAGGALAHAACFAAGATVGLAAGPPLVVRPATAATLLAAGGLA
jgi:hypothetical protein